ncbi:MAG: hypothetical protein Alpg2KO_02170 [Alphaproteobacteria bacterium]
MKSFRNLWMSVLISVFFVMSMSGRALAEQCEDKMIAPGAMATLCPSDPTADIRAEVSKFTTPRIYSQSFFDQLDVQGFKTGMSLDQVEVMLKDAGYTKYATSGKRRGKHVFCRGRKLLLKVQAFHPNGDSAQFFFTSPDLLGHQRVFSIEVSTQSSKHNLKSFWRHVLNTYGQPTLPFVAPVGYSLSYLQMDEQGKIITDEEGPRFQVHASEDRETGMLSVTRHLFDHTLKTEAELNEAKVNALMDKLSQFSALYPTCP